MNLVKKQLATIASFIFIVCLVIGTVGCGSGISKDVDAALSGSNPASSSNDTPASSGSAESSLSSSQSSTAESTQIKQVDWTDNWEANRFIAGFNEVYPNNKIVKKDVKAFENGAGYAADVKIDNIICRFSYSDGDPTLSILSKLPLNKNGRAKFFKQAAKALTVGYGLSIETTNRIMKAFDNGKAKQLGDEGEHKIYDSDRLSFLFTTDNDGYNYDLFTYKETRY